MMTTLQISMQNRVEVVVCGSRKRLALDDVLLEGEHQSWSGWTNGNIPRMTGAKRWTKDAHL